MVTIQLFRPPADEHCWKRFMRIGPGFNHSFHTRRTQDQPDREATAQARYRSKTTLTVQTDEGDRVTISIRAQSLLSVSSRSNSEGSVQTASESSKSRASLKVEGNLSDAELADVTKLIDALGTAAVQASQSGSVDAESLYENVSALGTLAAFTFSQRQSVEAGAMFRIAA